MCHLQTESLEAPHYRARVLSWQTLHRERTWIDFGDGEEEEKDDAHDGQDDIQMIMMHKSDLN